MVYSSNNRVSGEEAILTTLHYGDIFSFPLTQKELWRLLISKTPITKTAFSEALHSLITANKVVTRDGYYCLTGKAESITKRLDAKSEVGKKRTLALKAAMQLSQLSSVLFIGISGGLAVGDVSKEDDIDFFIITKRNTLYSTRLFLLLQLQKLGYRRIPGQKNAANTICLNLLIDETALVWPRDHQDVYTAREIAQLEPIVERDQMYRRFLMSNQWINTFLPNALEERAIKIHNNPSKRAAIPLIWEKLMRFIQISYMKRHHTTEIISEHFLAFHPNDYRIKILQELTQRMRKLGLLTKF